jgi:ankyrin repeat protein
MRRVLHLVLLLFAFAAQADSPLADAIKAGDRETAIKLIRSRADVNAAQNDGTTPLHWAVHAVDPELVRLLLARGANPNATNLFGVKPLAEAVKVAHVDMVEMLLKAGADVEASNEDGQTALMLAARTGVVPVARLLIEHGADVNAREQWRGQTALMWAAAGGHAEMTRFLASTGANVNQRAAVNDWQNQITSEPRAQYRPTGGLTPLLYAARADCQPCVDALLDHGADIDYPTPDGITPLMVAIDNLHFDLARHLLERGANPHTWDWWGRTPLYIATDMNSFVPRGSDRDEREGRTTALDIMRMLLAAGVNPNPQLQLHRPGRGGNSGRFTDDLLTTGATPLMRAAISFDIPAIRVLLEGGASVDLPNVMGVTPFMAAAGMGVSIRDPRSNYQAPDIQEKALATMQVLLEAGADINARATDTTSWTARIARPSTMTHRQGQTALYGAINWGWTKVVKFLLDHGARVDIVDAAGKTPLDAIVGNAGGRDHKNVPEVQAMIKDAMKGSARASL